MHSVYKNIDCSGFLFYRHYLHQGNIGLNLRNRFVMIMNVKKYYSPNSHVTTMKIQK